MNSCLWLSLTGKRADRIRFLAFLFLLVVTTSCQRRPFSDKIDGEWSGSTSEKQHSISFSVKSGRINQTSLSVDFEPEKTGALALAKCSFRVTFSPDSLISGRDFSVEGKAKGTIFGLAGPKSEAGTTEIGLRGSFTTEDAAGGELTLTLDKVPDCARFNGKHVFQWTARRDRPKKSG